MECVRQDEGDGGRLWGAMRKQDHVAGGKWRYAPSSTPKVTASPPTSVNSPEAFRRTIHAAKAANATTAGSISTTGATARKSRNVL